jgi:hypothetical protein
MKKILLTQGKFAIVDLEDYAYLNQWKWYAYKSGNTFYARRNIWTGKKRQTAIQMHREVMGCIAGDKKIVDHKNFNGLDNRKSNLQVVPISVNIHRRHKQKNNTSGYYGIYWRPKKKLWAASVRINGKNVSCGSSKDPIIAAKKRDSAVFKIFRENAMLNFPEDFK